ncbi:FAD:protein FMN transferase [Microbacterium aureliae]
MTRPAGWRFEAIGTVWSIETAEPLSASERRRVSAEIDEFDRAWSRFRPDSLVHALADGAGSVRAPADAAALAAVYDALAEATGGAVTPLVGDALAARGYDAEYSLADRGARPAPVAEGSGIRLENGLMSLDRPALIDVGAAGKGALVDRVTRALAAHRDLVVDAGGDIAVRGAAQRIGLEHPFDPRRAIGVWTVADAALCASATTRRAWGDGLHHVLDARTGEPVRRIAATWAVGADALHADAVATALFFDGGPELAAAWGTGWVRMLTDGRVEWSPGCEAELFTSG